jgi:hypothetical protein
MSDHARKMERLLTRLWEEASAVHGIDTCSDELRAEIKRFLKRDA